MGTKSTTKRRAPTAAPKAKSSGGIKRTTAARKPKTMAAGAGNARRKSSDVGDGVTIAESRPARKRTTRT